MNRVGTRDRSGRHGRMEGRYRSIISQAPASAGLTWISDYQRATRPFPLDELVTALILPEVLPQPPHCQHWIVWFGVTERALIMLLGAGEHLLALLLTNSTMVVMGLHALSARRR